MFLKEALVERFRNYKSCSLKFVSPINIFTGENGQGKSSFLEALYCALRGKSFHPFISNQFIQSQQESAKVRLILEEKSGNSEVFASFSSLGTGLKKEILYCGKKVGPSFLVKKFPVFVFTEASMKCIRQGPEQRRHFVDEMLCSEKQKQIQEDFNKALQQKKTLFKNTKQELLSYKEASKTLSALNHKFLELSFLLVQQRLSLLKELFCSLKNIKANFFKSPLPDLGFSYVFQNGQTFVQGMDVFSLLQEDLIQKEQRELMAGVPLSGPQKHEIQFLFNSENSRTFCSKGEQRALVLVLMAAHIQKTPHALLFLDDVLLELDEQTQNKFLLFLEKSHSQTFLTNCKEISFKTKKMSFFSVKNGTISQHD